MVAVDVPTLPVVVGQGSSGVDSGAGYDPIARVRTSEALTKAYSTAKGFKIDGGIIHGFILYENNDISYRTYVKGVQLHGKLEDDLRKDWKKEYASCDVFLAQVNGGSAGGTSAPEPNATDNLMFLYSHAMDDVDWARKRARGKVKVSDNIPARAAKAKKSD